jgi:general secretion pathway protein F
MTLKQRIKFYRQLAALVRGGVPIRTSLQRLAERMPRPEVRKLMHQIEQGETLGPAFAAARFSPFECHLVAAGERSAQLDTVFERLALFWERELRFIRALLRQLIYPACLAHLAIFVSALLLISQGTLAVVHALVFNLIYLYFAAFIAYMLIHVSWNSPVARRFWLLVPLIGGTLRAAQAYRWITALRMEFVAGVPFPEAVADAWRASGYLGAEAEANEAAGQMRSGIELSRLVERWRQLPRDWPDFFAAAEASGEYERTFGHIEEEAAHTWEVRQARMSDWVPKIVVFAFMIAMAIEIIPMASQAINNPIEQAEKAIDDAGR